MIYAIILFGVLFVATGVVHGTLKPHTTENKWIKLTHYWLEIAVVIQGMIIINYLLFAMQVIDFQQVGIFVSFINGYFKLQNRIAKLGYGAKKY